MGAAACDTKENVFPELGTVRLQVVDDGLEFQGASPPGFQVASWVIETAELTVTSGRTEPFEILRVRPCAYTDNVLLSDDVASTCGASGLVLTAGEPTTVTLRVVVSSMVLRRAEQPTLAADEDPDGDQYVTRYDNCPLVANPSQADANADGLGDACALVDPFTGVRDLPDTDGDTIADGIDNCRFVPNADQRDARRGADLIGDTCERFTDVILPQGGLRLELTSAIVPRNSSFTVLRVDFDSRNAVRCNADRTYCTVDPASVALTVVGG